MRKSLSAVVALLTVLVALALGSTAAAAAGSPARSISAVNVLESEILVELNAVRRQHGLAPLRLAPSLGAAADFHSRTMGQHGFFGHDSRNGAQFWERVKRFYGAKGYNSWSVGENLLWASPTPDAAEAIRLWMASPGHRKNILTARWREVGLSAVAVTNAPGVFGNRDVTIITTEFGVRG